MHWGFIAAAVGAGVLIGVPLSWVPLTAVPQRTAVSHAFGGLAAGLVGVAKFYLWQGEPESFTAFRTIGARGRGHPGLPHLHRQPAWRRGSSRR